jgi:hypothetical protein
VGPATGGGRFVGAESSDPVPTVLCLFISLSILLGAESVLNRKCIVILHILRAPIQLSELTARLTSKTVTGTGFVGFRWKSRKHIPVLFDAVAIFECTL